MPLPRSLTATTCAAAALVAMALVATTLAACARPETGARPAPADGAPPAAADSVALERGPCFGACPTYRVVIAADGRIAFASRGRDRVTHGAADGAAGAVAALARRAEESGFLALPDEISADRALCRDRATDMPTVAVTIFRAAGAKRVVDYRGCVAEPAAEPRLERLRALEAAIDSAAGSARWTGPGERS